MLTSKQLDKIEKRFEKRKMTNDDLYLLESHIFKIDQLQKEYGENLPDDVMDNLEFDLNRIINILSNFLKKQGVYNFPKNIDNNQNY